MGRIKDTGYVNPQDVYNYLVVNKGLSREHALGMLANIQAESGFKIAVQEYGKAAGTGGVGLYQHTGPRRAALMKYTGGNISDWTKQVDFALQESDTKKYLAQTFQTPEEASVWFTTKWERPANAQQRAQERLKYLNNYSTFSGYESEYVPAANTNTNQEASTGGMPPQTVIPFEVVVAGQPVQASFSYEEFEKALTTVKKAEEKTEQSAARQELEEQTSTQEQFLKAISSLSMPPESESSSQGRSQQQDLALGKGPYAPIEIPEMQGQLPQMPSLFSTQLPQMKGGGEPIKTIDGVQYVQDAQGNWKYASGAPVTDRALAQQLQYEPERPAVQGAPKPKILVPAKTTPENTSNRKIYPDPLTRNSETTQQVAAKTTPQTQEQRDNIEEVKRINRQRQSDLSKALQLEGYTPDQADSIIASYGSDWTTLEAAKARDIQVMNKTAADIQAGINPYSMKTFTPRAAQPLGQKVEDIIFNPVTAIGYGLRGQEVPDYLNEKIDNGTLGFWSNGRFVQGRNPLDTVVDVATPIGWIHSAKNILDRAVNTKDGDFWTEENAWDALNVLPWLRFARATKGADVAEIVKNATTTTNLSQTGTQLLNLAQRARLTASKPFSVGLGIDAGNIIREPVYAPQRPSLLQLGISPEQQKLLKIQQINNTTILSPLTQPPKLDIARASYKSQEGLPPYMNPSMYPTEQIMSRFTPEYQQYIRTRELQKAADRVIQRTTDDKIYYDAEGNIIKTPADNLKKGGEVSDSINIPQMIDGGSIDPPNFSLQVQPLAYNPNDLVGFRGYGNLTGASAGFSTEDLLGREKKINALKFPLSVSVNQLYDEDVQNTTKQYGFNASMNQDMSPEMIQQLAQQQLASQTQPYTDKPNIGFQVETGLAGSGINPEFKRRTRNELTFSGGYNPLSGFNVGMEGKLGFALGNDFYRPLRQPGDWRVAGNIIPFGMKINQQNAYNEQQDMIEQNLQTAAQTGEFQTATGKTYGTGYGQEPGLGSGVQVYMGAGLDASVKLPVGMVNAGAGVKYNRASGEGERLAPTAYLGYSLPLSELSRVADRLPNINLPQNNRSRYEELAGQTETPRGEWIQGADGKFTWQDYPGFNGAFNASTLEGEDIYVPSTQGPPTFGAGGYFGNSPYNFENGGRVSVKETKEMVDGIAQILAQVNNTKNRSEIARNMIYDFEREGLSYDLGKFLRNAGVK